MSHAANSSRSPLRATGVGSGALVLPRFAIRFDDFRCIGGYSDTLFDTEEEARNGWANLRRKKSRTNARLIINHKIVSTYAAKDVRAHRRWQNTPMSNSGAGETNDET